MSDIDITKPIESDYSDPNNPVHPTTQSVRDNFSTAKTEIETAETHIAGDGSDHADVAINTAHLADTTNPHSVTATQVGALADPTTTRGDTVARGATTLDRLAIGAADGLFLRSDGTDPSWVAPLASDVDIATGVGTPTVDQMQELIDNTGSSGFFKGGLVTDGGAGTIDIAAGEGFIRTTADPNAPLVSFKWSAVIGLAITDDTVRYIFVDNTGTVSANASEFVEAENLVLIGVAINEGGAILSVYNLGVRLEESIAQAGRFLRRTLSISRDVRRGGLALGETGTRNITLSAGHLWWGRTDYPITAINTSGADTFDAFYQDGVGGTTIESARTTWNNTQYDDGSGTLATLTNNKWAVQWFFIEPDEHLSTVYGTASYNSMALAELEPVPTVLPARISASSILVGRILFQKSATTATVESAFSTAFVAGGASSGDMLADGSVPFTGLPAGIDSFQNILINALGTINQRGYVSGTATTSANQYTLDRWRVPTSGQNLAFTESLNKVIFTPPASGIEQAIEGKNIQSQTYTISWVQDTGTTTCTVGGTARTNGESFVLVGGVDTTVQFKSGTFSFPQVTLGSLVKPFEHRDYASELLRCQRYYFIVEETTSGNNGQLLLGMSQSSSQAVGSLRFPTTMRTYNVSLDYPSTYANDIYTRSTASGSALSASTSPPTIIPRGANHCDLFYHTGASMTAYIPHWLLLKSSTNSPVRLGIDAEL